MFTGLRTLIIHNCLTKSWPNQCRASMVRVVDGGHLMRPSVPGPNSSGSKAKSPSALGLWPGHEGSSQFRPIMFSALFAGRDGGDPGVAPGPAVQGPALADEAGGHALGPLPDARKRLQTAKATARNMFRRGQTAAQRPQGVAAPAPEVQVQRTFVTADGTHAYKRKRQSADPDQHDGLERKWAVTLHMAAIERQLAAILSHVAVFTNVAIVGKCSVKARAESSLQGVQVGALQYVQTLIVPRDIGCHAIIYVPCMAVVTASKGDKQLRGRKRGLGC